VNHCKHAQQVIVCKDKTTLLKRERFGYCEDFMFKDCEDLTRCCLDCPLLPKCVFVCPKLGEGEDDD